MCDKSTALDAHGDGCSLVVNCASSRWRSRFGPRGRRDVERIGARHGLANPILDRNGWRPLESLDCSRYHTTARRLIMTDLSLRVFDNVLDMLSSEQNPTPMVRLNRVAPFKHTAIY